MGNRVNHQETRWLGRAVYRATVRGGEPPGLRDRLDAAVRAEFEPDGFTVRAAEQFTLWTVVARRGLTAGLMVGVIPKSPGPGADLLVGVSRWSRLDEWAGWVAGGCGLLVAAAVLLVLDALGVPLPGPVQAVAVLGTGLASLLAAYTLSAPLVAALELLGGGRLPAARVAAVVEQVRAAVEATSGSR